LAPPPKILRHRPKLFQPQNILLFSLAPPPQIFKISQSLLPLTHPPILARCFSLHSSLPLLCPITTPSNPSAMSPFPLTPPTTLSSLVLSHSPSTPLSCRALPLCLSPPLSLSHQRVGEW
jgi:hypothetical protein